MEKNYNNIPLNQIEKQKKYFYGAILDVLFKFEEGYPFLDNRLQNLINQIKEDEDWKYICDIGQKILDYEKICDYYELLYVSNLGNNSLSNFYRNVKLNDNATGNVTVTVDGFSNTSDVVNGQSKILISNLDAGFKNVTVFYTGDDTYFNLTKTSNFT